MNGEVTIFLFRVKTNLIQTQMLLLLELLLELLLLLLLLLLLYVVYHVPIGGRFAPPL